MHPFFFTLPSSPPLSLKVGSASLLCENVKQYPVLYDKQVKGYREKRCSDLELIENCKSKSLLFFMLYLEWQIIWALRRIGRFVLFSRKKTRKGGWNQIHI